MTTEERIARLQQIASEADRLGALSKSLHDDHTAVLAQLDQLLAEARALSTPADAGWEEQ